MSRLDRVKKFIKENGFNGWQAYDTRNIVGDEMETVYRNWEDGVTIDVCRGYQYLEIFGLTKEEWDELYDPDKDWDRLRYF